MVFKYKIIILNVGARADGIFFIRINNVWVIL